MSSNHDAGTREFLESWFRDELSPSVRESRDIHWRDSRSGLIQIRADFGGNASTEDRVACLRLFGAVHFHQVTNLFGFEHRERNAVPVEKSIRCCRREPRPGYEYAEHDERIGSANRGH